MDQRTAPPRDPGTSPWALPDPATADRHGLLGVGADLAPATMVAAYRRGLFPWPHEDMPLPWFSPDPRAVFDLAGGGVHVSRSLRRTLRTSGWTTTLDMASRRVVAGCRHRPGEGTWITDDLARAYDRLAGLGWVHTLEVWDGDELVGGVVGLLVGGVFTGESMFHRADDASKVALVDLADRLVAGGGAVLDAQLPTPHLDRMGAVAWPRERFLAVLANERDRDVRLPVERLPASRLA